MWLSALVPCLLPAPPGGNFLPRRFRCPAAPGHTSLQRVPAASDTKKPKKDAGDEGLTRAMKKMLALKQVAASKAVGGRMNAPQQPNQLQQRQRQDRAQPGAPGAQPEQQQLGAGQQREPARGHEAPAAGAQQGPQVPQAKAPQGKQGPDSLFQQKRLKVRGRGRAVQ